VRGTHYNVVVCIGKETLAYTISREASSRA